MSHRLFGSIACCAVASLFAGGAVAADCPGGCATPSVPTVLYGYAPPVVDLPPIGYVLDPSDARKPIYIVNQGPVYSGPLIINFAVPTYSEGGYAYATPYPYVRVYADWYGGRYDQRFFYDSYSRRHVRGPYAAYRYRPAPSARIIEVPGR